MTLPANEHKLTQTYVGKGVMLQLICLSRSLCGYFLQLFSLSHEFTIGDIPKIPGCTIR